MGLAVMNNSTPTSGLLDGLEVAEHGGSLAAAITGGLLADLGATVRLIEPADGSDLRARPGFSVWGRAKHAAPCVDTHAELVRSAMRADVVVVDDDDWLLAGQPRGRRTTLVIDAFGGPSIYGLPGPLAAAAMGEAYSGLSWLQQGSRDGPYYLLESPASFGCGVLGVIAVLASLVSSGGQQETCRVSHLAGALALQLFGAVTASDAPVEHGFADGDCRRMSGPLNRLHKASDGWVDIAISKRSRFERVCTALGLDDLLGDDRFARAPVIPDKDARTEVVARIAERVATMTVAEVVRVMNQIDVIVGPVFEPGEALDNPQVAAVGLRYETRDEAGAMLVMPGVPIYRVEPGPGTRQPGTTAPRTAGAGISAREAGPSWAPRTNAGESARAPLDGLRVLEMATYAAGPGAARVLAGLGATVLKIEAPEGDPLRPQDYFFVGANEDKMSTRLNLKDPQDAQTLRDLIARSHVVLNNYRPEIADRLGVSPEAIAAVNPNAVQCAVLGYGSTGPLANSPAFDIVFECLTGGALIQGGGTDPVGYGGGIADNGTSLLGAAAVLAGLYGQMTAPTAAAPVVELSLMSTVLYRHADVFVRGRSDWRALPGLRPDPDHVTGSLGLFATADDKWLLLGVTRPAEWDRLTAIVDGLPSSFRAGTDSAWDRDVRRALEGHFAGLPFGQCEAELQHASVPYCPALPFKSFALDSHRAQDRFVSRFAATSGEREYVGVQDLIEFGAHRWVQTSDLVEINPAHSRTLFA